MKEPCRETLSRIIKNAVEQNYDVSVEQLIKLLKDRGHADIKLATVSSIRSIARKSQRLGVQ